MRKIISTLSVAALLSIGLPIVSAQGEGAEQLFAQLDANKDGKLSLSEFTAHPDMTAEMFKTYDKDGDKSLSKAEFVEGVGA